jgi:hypothetical protein
MVSHAARAAGINRQYAYEVKASDAEFGRAWDEIREAALDEVEVAAFKHAKDGDAKLITFLLSTTGRYRDTKHVEHSGSLNLVELVATVEDEA